MNIALTREISPGMQQCELTYLTRVSIDLELARAQHQAYQQVLADLGCRVVTLPAEPALPDSVFVEDTAIVLDEMAVITRPGAESRRPETASVAEALRPYRKLAFIEAPGTIDGGDVLRVGKKIYVGCSGRSNPAGIDQLAAATAPFGYDVCPVPLTGCLHLKSAVTQASADTLLINRQWVNPRHFEGMRLIDVHPDEPHAANALLLGGAVIYPTCFPLTRQRLEANGSAVRVVDVSEVQKAEGAVTCCSLIFKLTTG
jgi:dimethylargininase